MMAATSSPRPSVISGSPSDASSLRAAALKTLKMGKRRRPASGQTQIVPLARAVPQDTLQLDYGQDDNTPESPRALPKVPSPPVSPHRDTSSVPHNARDMDVDMREEGEISDEDISPVEVNSFKPAPDNADDAINSISNDQPSVPTSRSGSPMPALLTRLSIPQSPATISPTPSIPYAERARSFPALDINQGSIMASPATYFSNGSPQERSPFPRESSNRSVSPGSGNSYVPAHGPQNYEMFVDRHDIHPGLSMTQTEYDAAKDIVLDLLGWGVPPHYLVDCGLSKELVFYVFRDLRLRLPSNLALHGALHEFETSSSGSPVHVEDPSANQLTSRIDGPVHNLRRPTPDPTTPLTDAPTVAATPTPEELEDMERRRRQELLARKEAVLASRKEKRPDTDSSIVHPSGESDSDVIMAPPAPTETVEDFLKSISPAKQGDVLALEQTTIETSLRDMDGMETDEIPGLCSSRPSFAVSPSPTSSQYLTPPSSGDSITSFSAQVQLPSEFAFNRPSRNRGTRRPVASDFVDVEDGHPSTSGFGSSAIKRKLQSGMNFSNIGMRRCIIDLSDSEDDEHDFEFLKRSQTAPALRAGQNFNVSRVSASSPAPAATTKARSSTVTPSPEASALELQILKMREEIAQKEQNRKRKALAKLNTTPSANTPYSTTPISGELVSREQSVHPQTHALARPTTPPISVSDSGSVYQDLSNIPDDIILVTSPIGNTNHVQAPSTPPFDEPEGSQAQTTELVQPSTDATNPGEDGPVSPTTNHADAALSLSARVLQDEYLFEPEPSFDSAPNSPDLSFQPYQSTLSSYPLLRAQVTPPRLLASDALPSDFFTEDNNGFRSTLVSDAYSHLPTLVLPDLQPLKLATVMKYLDPSKRLCQYEVPGGGVCRDEGCDDVHLTRLPMGIDEEVAEPSDQETANFLLGAVPFEWQARNNATVGKMIAALTLVRQSASLMTLSFEERVRRALLVLEPPPPVPKTS